MTRLARLLILLAGVSSASAAVLISSKGTSPDIPPPALWTFDQIDSETGSYDEIDATTFDIHGESGTIEQGGSFLYQTVTSGNIQIIAEVAAFSGTTVANTAAGPMIRSSLLPNARLAAAHFTADGRTKARSRNTDGDEAVSTAFGSSGGLAPQCEALWFNAATSRVTTYENPGPDCSPTAAGWTIVLADNPFNIPAPYFAGLSALSLQPSESVTAQFQQVQLSTTKTIFVDSLPQCSDTVDNDGDTKIDFGVGGNFDPGCSSALDNDEFDMPPPLPQCNDNIDNDCDGKIDFDGIGTPTGGCPAYTPGVTDPGCANATDDSEVNVSQRNGIKFTADWETGSIRPDFSNPDGFYVKGFGPPLGATPAGPCTKVSGNDGGGEWDVPNPDFTRVVHNSEGIQLAYTGVHSLRLLIHYNCDYNLLGAGGGTIGGPKDKARTAIQTQNAPAPGTLPMGEPVWIGYATFFPANWKPETSNAQASDMPIFEMAMDTDNSALTTVIERAETVHPETGGQNLGGYGVTVLTQSSTGPGLPATEGTIPRVTFDLRDIMGRWVVWVWRVVMSSDSSPPGRVDLWIDGVKIYGNSIPIGANAVAQWHPIFEIYKGDWKDSRHQPSSIPASWPIEYFLDSVRYGIEADSAGYDDVHPLQAPCPNNCQ